MSRFFAHEVFVSYSSTDRERVAGFVHRLRQAHRGVYFDVWELHPGDVIRRSLKKAIDECTLGVVFLSAAAVSREWIEWEVRELLERGKVVIPVFLEPCQPPDWLPTKGISLGPEEPDLREKQLVLLIEEIGDRLVKVRWRVPALRRIAVLLTGVLLILITLAASVGRRQSELTVEQLRQMQESIQKIDERVQADLNLAVCKSGSPEEFHYLDSATRELLAVDDYSDGLLRARSYYSKGLVAATDSLQYAGGAVIEKVRQYSLNRMLTLEDRFGQDGALQQKVQVVNGDPRNTRMILDRMRSPIPKTAIPLGPVQACAFYR